jgi:hypothetical protein
MSKKNYSFSLVFLFAIFLFFLIEGCDDSGINPDETSIGGTVTFTSTNLYPSNLGYYAISLYPEQAPALGSDPLRSDSLNISISGNTASAYFKMSGIGSGYYYIAVTWIRKPNSPYEPNAPILGTFGCDTTHGCTSHTRIEFPSYAGTNNTKILSWTDTLKKLN